MNPGNPQQQDPNVAQQAWPSFMETPTPAAYVQQSAPSAAPPVQQSEPTFDPWGMASRMTPNAVAPQTHPQVQQYNSNQNAPVQQYAMGAGQPHPQYQYAPAASDPVLYPHPPASAPGGGFSFATPQGMQIVQPPIAGAPMQHVVHAGASQAPATRKRMRWEMIVPAGTAAVLLATAIVVFTNFDRITGASNSAPSSNAAQVDAGTATPSAGVSSDAAAGTAATAKAAPTYPKPGTFASAPDAKLTPAEGRAAVVKARQLVKLGRYDEATATISPLAPKGQTAPPAVARLQQQIVAASKINDSLLTKLGQQRDAGSWSAVLATLTRLGKLHPLSPEFVKLRAQAQQHVRPGAAPSRAAAVPAAVVGGGKVTKVPPAVSDKHGAAAPVSPGSTSASPVAIATPPTSTPAGTAPQQPGVANPSAAPSNAGVSGQPVSAPDASCMAGMAMNNC